MEYTGQYLRPLIDPYILPEHKFHQVSGAEKAEKLLPDEVPLALDMLMFLSGGELPAFMVADQNVRSADSPDNAKHYFTAAKIMRVLRPLLYGVDDIPAQLVANPQRLETIEQLLDTRITEACRSKQPELEISAPSGWQSDKMAS